MSVAFSARLSLIMYPVTLLFYLGFMKVVDTPHRMQFFYFGVVMVLASYMLYPVLGFSVGTYVAFTLLNNLGRNPP